MHVSRMGVLFRYLTVGAGAALATLGLAGSHDRLAAREFRAADIQEESYPTVQALLFMDKLVAERSGGRHRIRVFHSRQLGEESQTIEQTRVGAIDLDRINVAAIGDVAPTLNILAQPFLFRSIDHLYKVIDGPIGDDILAAIEPNGFIGLTFYDSGARSIYTRSPPVRGLPDLKGLRIRVQQSDLVIRMMKALGAEPVALPYGQVLTALSTQLVDGAENNWPSYVTTGHYKVAQFYTVTEHTMGPEVLVMSRRAWQELSDPDRAIFRDAARESSRYMRAQWQSWEEQSRKQAVEAGATIIEHFDRKPFEDATRPLRDEMRADPRFGPLIERIQAVQ
jgi:tripartite ATP-independent transporter DctP family solute receptor